MSSRDRSPLTARCDSSGSDDLPDRNSPSPITMLSSQLNGTEPYSHDYANPQDIQQELIELNRMDGAKKKRNLVYEATDLNKSKANNQKLKNNRYVPPLPPPRRRSGSSDMTEYESFISASTSPKKSRKLCLFTYLVVAVFVISLGAVTLAVISFMGKDSEDKQNGGTSSDTVIGSENLKPIHLNNMKTNEMHWLKNNISHLQEHVIPSLEAKINELVKKLEDKSLQGPVGPVGPAGPPGIGDLSQCEYQSMTKSNIENAVTESQYVTEDDKYKIMGVTCSQDGAAFASLTTRRGSNGNLQYYCRCAGPASADIWKSTDGYITCRIHYWRCPVKTK